MNENKFMLLFMGPLIAITLISIITCSIVIKKAIDYQTSYESRIK